MNALSPRLTPARPLEILILEDQALVRAGMRALIQISEPHAHIREAASYEEAVALAKAGRSTSPFSTST